MRYLFIGAHPDDIELGAGGTISKARRMGIECESLIFSNCKESFHNNLFEDDTLIRESIRAHNILGVAEQSLKFFDFPLRHFSRFRQDILQVLIEESSQKSWDRIFVPNTLDIHQDHSALAVEAIRVFKTQTILGYELPWNNLESKIDVYNEIDEADLRSKIRALSCFESQAHRSYMDGDSIEAILRFRGLQTFRRYCEGFQSIRFFL